jgi:hypothetical protein
MIRKLILALIILTITTGIGRTQSIIKTSDLFSTAETNNGMGKLKIIQDPALDTLISRYILGNKMLRDKYTYLGMEGCRIQIFNSSNRNAREESGKVKAEFITKFPDIKAHELFENPGYFKVRVGDFRSKTEATKLFLEISKEFPDAYTVPDFINFPEGN